MVRDSLIWWCHLFLLHCFTICAFRKHVLRFPNACFAVQLLFFFLSRNVWLSSWTMHGVHCSRTHKFYFSATFSLKMGPIVLFIHLKIILLQYFQFSVFSCIQTDPITPSQSLVLNFCCPSYIYFPSHFIISIIDVYRDVTTRDKLFFPSTIT